MRQLMVLTVVACALLVCSAHAPQEWQPRGLLVSRARSIDDGQGAFSGTLDFYFVYQIPQTFNFGNIWFCLDLPEMDLGAVYVTTREPVLYGQYLSLYHQEGSSKSTLDDADKLSLYLGGWERSLYADEYLVLKRDSGFLLLHEGQSEYEMMSAACPLAVSANVMNLGVLDYDQANHLLYLRGMSSPDGALFKYEVNEDQNPESLPAHTPSRDELQHHVIAYDTASKKIIMDWSSQPFEPLYAKDGLVYGKNVSDKSRCLLEVRSMDNMDHPTSALQLGVGDDEKLEAVYPWKPGELIVVTQRSIYRLNLDTSELTYVLDLVEPAHKAIAEFQAKENETSTCQ